jgi:hypothetical protein
MPESHQDGPPAPQVTETDRERFLFSPRAAASLLVCFAVAGVTIVLFLLYLRWVLHAAAEAKTVIEASQLWDEFDQDTKVANARYKGRFVQVRGKVKMVTFEQTTHTFLAAGPDDARWGIEFLLPRAETEQLKDGDEITLHCLLGTRKQPDGNLNLSKCTLVKIERGQK